MLSICKLAYKPSKANVCPTYGRTNYRPIFEMRKLGLLPYMVMWISTGNGRNLHQNPFKFEIVRNLQSKNKFANKKTTPAFTNGMFIALIELQQETNKICINSF